ncbi:MAG: DUF4269 domain-containing protein [Pseudomonadota bacterium]
MQVVPLPLSLVVMKPHFDDVIDDLDLLYCLARFDPIVIGTPPLGIALESSDIDIACSASDLEQFGDVARKEFAHLRRFSLRYVEHLSEPAMLATFVSSGWEIELFCQRLRTEEQWGVRHFRVEERLLSLEPNLRREVLRLKRLGFKTEPAFAKLLQLSGDPYEAILSLESKTDNELLEIAKRPF